MTHTYSIARIVMGMVKGKTQKVVGVVILVVFILEAIFTMQIGQYDLEAEVQQYLLSHSVMP